MDSNAYYEAVFKAAHYIEDNLGEDLNVRDIANTAGFSPFHFMRIFKSVSGHTLNGYIKRRKITEAAGLVLGSGMRLIDIAFQYGYASQEAFTRAFREVYGTTPHAYRAARVAYANIGQIRLSEEILKMKAFVHRPAEPEIVSREGFHIAGIRYRGRNENFEIPKLWNRFREQSARLAGRTVGHACYGLESYSGDSAKTGLFEYIAGVEVDGASRLPEGMDGKRVAGGKYAVFPIPAVIENVPRSISEIYAFHLPASGLKTVGDFDFEYYDSRFVPNKPDSNLYFYIPVE